MAAFMLVAGAASAAPAALTVEYEYLLGSDTPLPSDPSLFFDTIDGFRLTHRQGKVVFTNSAGILPPSRNGVFEHSAGSASSVAESGIPPFDVHLGRLFSDPHFDGDTTTFFAAGAFGVSETYVSIEGESPRRLVGNGDLTDGGGAINSFTLTPRVIGDQIVLGTVDTLGNSRIERVAASGGVPETLFDADSPLEPDGADYDITGYGIGGTSGDRYAFWGQTSSGFVRGIFVGNIDGTVIPIARRGDPAPDGTFQSLTSFPSIDGDTVAFVGSVLGGVSTVYTADTANPGAFEIVADVTNPLINDTLSGLPAITTLRGPSVSGNTVAFVGESSDGFAQALFVARLGEIIKIARVGETLDGKTLSFVFGGSFGLDGNDYVFSVEFTDGSTGLYRATIVPAPSAAAALALTPLALAARRRRRDRL